MSLFKDEAEITCVAGRGGDGCISFRHEAFEPKGGPDGGNGGNGGSIVLCATDEESSLMDLMRRRIVKAKNGMPGRGTNCYGANAENLIVKVPLGTMVFHADSGELMADLTEEGDEFFVARGGKGGRGNKSFATSTNQVPRECELGTDGGSLKVRLELKLIADVGLVGFPNAGKSTFLAHVSAAKPRVASYPFTTLEPQLGIVQRDYHRLVIADIPGLIEGASEGKGLGHQFLRHIERTRVILHIVDLSDFDPKAQIERYHAIRHELESFSPLLASKPEIIAVNKMDTEESTESLEYFLEGFDKPVLPMSGVTGQGVKEVLDALTAIVRVAKEEEAEAKASAERAAAAALSDDGVAPPEAVSIYQATDESADMTMSREEALAHRVLDEDL